MPHREGNGLAVLRKLLDVHNMGMHSHNFSHLAEKNNDYAHTGNSYIHERFRIRGWACTHNFSHLVEKIMIMHTLNG